MQEKIQNISPIKQRILQFVETLNISKRTFYNKIGVSRGTLESKTGITEDVVTKFIAEYPEISAEWLLRGEGDMFLTDNQLTNSQQINGNGNSGNVVNAGTGSEQVIEILKRQLEEKDEQIRQLMQHLK